jgi:hypothetical protein
MHDEAMDMLYVESVFELDVAFDAIDFQCRWLTASGFVATRQCPFLEHFGQRNLLKVRSYVVNVEPWYSYTNMTWSTCEGRGFLAGVRVKVQELVDQLVAAPVLQRVQIHLLHGVISPGQVVTGRVRRV